MPPWQRLIARAGSEGNHGLEGASLGERVQVRAGDGDLYFALRDVDDGSVARDFDGLGHRADLEFDIDIRQAADGQVDADLFESAESRNGHGQAVGAGGNCVMRYVPDSSVFTFLFPMRDDT